MALACNPELLIADEPTTALDVTIQAQILELIKRFQADIGTSVILITHDLGVVAEMCNRVIVMYAGRVVEQADVKELFANPQHPYTQGLMGAIPILGEMRDRLEVIPGSVPNLIDPPAGCKFAPRCKVRVETNCTRCEQEEPELIEITPGHKSRCWVAQGKC
jgi:peptide/nickel transport system ATP-binding protein